MARYLPLSALGLLALGTLLEGCLITHSPKVNQKGGATEPSTSLTTTNGETSASTTQPEVGEPSDTSEPNESSEGRSVDDCSDDRDSVCLAPLPSGWQGPVQPQSTNQIEKLIPCPVGLNPQDFWEGPFPGQPASLPDASRNIFVDTIDAAPAKCTGCETELDLGTCVPPKYVLRTRSPSAKDPCGPLVPGFKPLHLGPSCHSIDFEPKQLLRNQVLSAISARPRKDEASCAVVKQGVEELPPARAQNFFRICRGQPMQKACESADTQCLRFQRRHEVPHSPVACVYRRGEHSCPDNQPYTKRTLIYGSMRDDRNCGTCEAKHEEGEIKCAFTLFLSERDRERTCATPKELKPETLCLSAQQLQIAKNNNAPYTMYGTSTGISYSGSCEPAPSWGPSGQAIKTEPFTLCCTPMPE